VNSTAAFSLLVAAGVGAADLAAQRAAAPISWSEVAASYGRVRDYTALYEKEERSVDGGERQRIRLFFRKPQDLRLEWLDSKGNVDQTVVFRKGHNEDKLIARRTGLLGSMIGTVKLDPTGRLAMQESRHPVTQVGIGHMIDTVMHDLSTGAVTSRLIGEETLDNHPADHLQLSAARAVAVLGVESARRADVWIDRTLELPVKIEVHDAAGTLLERHRFTNLRLNTALTDRTFEL
jgi:outer membrane lipoprotein-sorting protein